MSINSLLSKNRMATGILCVVLISASALYLYYTMRPAPLKVTPPTRFYSTDDGQTFFQASTYDFSPCQIAGKPALQAAVFVNAAGKPFVAYLIKYTPEAQDFLRGINVAPDADPTAPTSALNRGTLVKLPGSPTWIPQSDPAASPIINPLDPATKTPLTPYYGG